MSAAAQNDECDPVVKPGRSECEVDLSDSLRDASHSHGSIILLHDLQHEHHVPVRSEARISSLKSSVISWAVGSFSHRRHYNRSPEQSPPAGCQRECWLKKLQLWHHFSEAFSGTLFCYYSGELFVSGTTLIITFSGLQITAWVWERSEIRKEGIEIRK